MARGKRMNRRKNVKRRQRKNRKNKNVPEYASCSVKRTIQATGTNFSPNTLYSLMNTTLSQYVRASAVAQAYQYYRIKKIALTVKPPFDTYGVNLDLSGTATGLGKPNFYYMIDKSGSVPSNISLEGLKQMGARPRQLDEKNITVSWAPSVLDVVMTGAGATPTSQPAKYKISPWINTSATVSGPGAWTPNDVDHLGIYWYIDQFGGRFTTLPLYQCEVEVQFEFKKPLTLFQASAEAIPATGAHLNDSPDGIVGGNDGV